ncbi:MAG: phage holin family protein [Pseudomonadota bacterium]
MTDATVEPVEPEEAPEEAGVRQSVPELLAELVEDGHAWLDAELAVFHAEARRRLIIAGIGIGLMTLAATMLAGTLIALLVGAMFALGPVVGPGWATVIIIVLALTLSAAFAQAGRIQLRKLTRKQLP